MNYSVIATTFNDSAEIIKYLENICNQSYLPNEIVIADGGSKDNTIEKIQKFALSSVVTIRVIKKGRLNISQGYNEAIKAARNDIIGVTGIGNYYDKFFFEDLIKVIEKKRLDYVYSPIRGYSANRFSKRYNDALLNGESGNCFEIASNHGVLIKKKVFEELNYFYDKFIYAGEDSEFYSLVKSHGYKGEIVKEAKVYWKTPTCWNEFLKQIRVYTIADLQINSKKYWNRLSKRLIKLFLMVIAVALGIVVALIPCRITLKLLYALVIVAVLVARRKKLNIFKLASLYLPIFYALKYKKYMNDEYAVRREEK